MPVRIVRPLVAALAFALAATAPASAANIVETAASTGQFNTLLAAAKAAGLASDLATGTPLTVFAPTDAAFAKLPRGTVENLLRPENRQQLRAILAYHVVPARILAAEVPPRATKVGTLSPGASVTAQRRGGVVHVDGVRVVKADVVADNGVIHVIGRVLMPPAR